MLAVVAGVVGTARAMFLSDHDLSVVLLVVVVAGFVAIVVSVAVGTAFTRWSRTMREDARRFGESGEFDAGSRGPAELQQLSDELAMTARGCRSPGLASSGWRSRGASWSPGSPTTCAPRSRRCAR